MSKCQSRINARSKEQLYSITSSARASRVDGRRRQWDVRYASIVTALVDRIATDAVRQTGTMTRHTSDMYSHCSDASHACHVDGGWKRVPQLKIKNGPLCQGPLASHEREFQEATFVLTALAAGVCLVTTFLFLEP